VSYLDRKGNNKLRNVKKTFENLDKKQVSAKTLLVTPPATVINLDGGKLLLFFLNLLLNQSFNNKITRTASAQLQTTALTPAAVLLRLSLHPILLLILSSRVFLSSVLIIIIFFYFIF
jgi:hypothetical protein